VYSVVWGVGWVRDLVCVMEAGGGDTWDKCCYVYMRTVKVRFWYPIMCVEHLCTLYTYLMYVLGCNIQGYGNCSFL